MSEKTAARLEPMDALRGFAALCVAVFSHYQHWGGAKERYPFLQYKAASWLYVNSWLFVDLFFLLSGMVLTLRYLEPITDNRIGAKEFLWLRFSRLYPLHLATLLVCAGVEWPLMAAGQPTVIYPHNNDLYHFVLHATYLHSGWFEHGWAYNMPSWSVASEVLVYVIFFVIASRYKKNYPVAIFVLFLVGMGIQAAKLSYPVLNENMARGMVGFSLGSLLYLGMNRLERAGHGLRLGIGCLVALAVVCGLAYWIGFDAFIGGGVITMTLTVFPLAVIASLRVPPLARLLSLRPLTFLGDISYAVYLVHVPLQMVVLSVTQSRHITLPIYTNAFFFEYAAAVVLVATAAHYGLEKPAQRWLRGRLRSAPAHFTSISASAAP
jgi:peptidoglycan/LPS O-acetylase OafA/YrhL